MPTGGTDIALAVEIMAAAGAAASAYGTYKSGQDAKAAASNQAAEQRYEQNEANVQAGQVRASAQRQALSEQHNADLTRSRAIALNAGNGGDSLDPSVVDVLGDLQNQGNYNKNAALYEGETKANGLEAGGNINAYNAESTLAAGRSAASSANIKAAGGLVSDSASLYSKYGEKDTYQDPNSPLSANGLPINWNYR